jgi:hypothetical protein
MRRKDWEIFREALREDRRRADQWLAQMFARWEKEHERRHEEVMAHLAKQDRTVDDLLEESRAQRAALLAVLDRLNGGGGTAPAA